MSTTINLYTRDGKTKIFTWSLPFNMNRCYFAYDGEKRICSLEIGDGNAAESIQWFTNTANYSGVSSSPNKTEGDLKPWGEGQLSYIPVWNIYEAYSGVEAESGYALTTDSENGYVLWDTSLHINPTIYNVVTLPDPLPSAVKQTIGGGFLSLVNWYYDPLYTEIAYPNERLDGDTTIYAAYQDIGVDINIYNSTGTTLKAAGRYVDTLTGLSLYRIADNYGLFVNANAQDYTIDWSIVAGYELLGLAREVGGEIWLTMGQTKETPIMTYGTINLYEVEEIVQPPDSFSITYVTNGGTLEENFPNPQTDLYAIPEYLPTCVKDGNIFDGWYYDADFNNPAVLGATLEDDINLYAKFITISTIDIVLYQNKSENNRVNKKKYLTKVMTMQGTFRQSVNIIAPTITIEAENLPQFNYMYISAFGRYYFVNSITNVNTNVWQINASCDVLYSYVNTIRSQVAYVARNENEYNLNVTDNTFNLNLPTTTNKTLVTLTKDAGWIPYDKTFYTDAHKRGVILMQGFLTDRNENILQNSFGLSCIISRMDYTQQFLSVACQNTVDWLSSKLMSDLIVSAKAFPFSIPTNNIEVGYWKIKTLLGVHDTLMLMGNNKHYTPTKKYLIDSVWEFEIRKPHPSSRENYLNYNPYTTVFIEFLPYGRFEIDTKLLFRTGDVAKLIITARTNVITGESALYWKTGSVVTEVEYYLGTANVAMDIPFSGTATSTQKFVSGVATIGATVATAAAMASGGGIGAAGAIGLATSAMGGASQITEAVTSPITTVSGGTYSIIDQTPKVLVETKQLSGASYSTLGSPLYAERKLNTLTGFTNVVSVNLQGFNTATTAEVSEIEQHLKTGVIL